MPFFIPPLAYAVGAAIAATVLSACSTKSSKPKVITNPKEVDLEAAPLTLRKVPVFRIDLGEFPAKTLQVISVPFNNSGDKPLKVGIAEPSFTNFSNKTGFIMGYNPITIPPRSTGTMHIQIGPYLPLLGIPMRPFDQILVLNSNKGLVHLNIAGIPKP